MAWYDNRPGDDGFYRGDSPVNGPDFGQHDGSQQMWPGSNLYGSGQLPGPADQNQADQNQANQNQTGQNHHHPDFAAPTRATFSAGPQVPAGRYQTQYHPQLQSYGQQPPPPRLRLAAVLGAVVVVLLLIGGVTYFFLGRPDQGESEAVTSAAPETPVTRDPASAPEVQRAEGAPESGPDSPAGQASVQYDDATLTVSIASATWQPGSAWSEPWEPTEAGFLVINMSLERIDAGTSSTTIPWWSWTFQSAEGGAPVEAELIGGGYEPTLSSASLAAGAGISGVLSFAVKSTAGTLTLSDFTSEVGQWAVQATPAEAPTAAFGTPVTSPVGGFPLEVTLQQPIWDANPDAVVGTVPDNGYWLYADYSAALSATAPADIDAFASSIRYDSWHFLPDAGGDFEGDLGEIYGQQTSMTYVEPGVPGSGRFRIDAPAQAGTLALVGEDGTVIMKWVIAAP